MTLNKIKAGVINFFLLPMMIVEPIILMVSFDDLKASEYVIGFSRFLGGQMAIPILYMALGIAFLFFTVFVWLRGVAIKLENKNK